VDNNGNYLKIPLGLLELRLSPVETYIVALAISYGGDLWASNSKLAEIFSVSVRAVKYAVARLEHRGENFVKVKRVIGVGRTIELKEKFAPFMNGETSPEVVQKLPPAGAVTSPPLVQKLPSTGAKVAPKTNTKETDKGSLNKRGLGKASSSGLVLGFEKKLLSDSNVYCSMIEREFSPFTPREYQTFHNILLHLNTTARNGEPNAFIEARSILSDKLDFIRRNDKPKLEAKKMFVSAIKKRFGGWRK